MPWCHAGLAGAAVAFGRRYDKHGARDTFGAGLEAAVSETMTMSFFQWVREGVRHAVVLGVADAFEDIGTRSRDEDLGAQLAQTLRDRLGVTKQPTVLESSTVPVAGGTSTGGRRRLGRSIEGLRKSAA